MAEEKSAYRYLNDLRGVFRYLYMVSVINILP